MRTYTPACPEKNSEALWRSVGFPSSRGPKLVNTLRGGLSISVLDTIHLWSNIPKSDILKMAGIGQRNVSRRKSADGIFTPEESERIARLVRVMDASVELFSGDRQRAAEWMRQPVRGLGDVTPESLLDTESGALEVLDLIGRLEHGVLI